MKVYNKIINSISSPNIIKHVSKILNQVDGAVLDIGCGVPSIMQDLILNRSLVGVDVLDFSSLQKLDKNHHYISCNVIDYFDKPEDFLKMIEEKTGISQFNVVTAFNVIEHMERKDGKNLLDFMERITSRFCILETPCGFVPQGPEFGNEYQRHLSGWFVHDFEGRGYTVKGSLGTNLMRGYLGEPKIKLPGMRTLDNVLLARILNTQRKAKHAFNICAFKDKEGVPARYG